MYFGSKFFVVFLLGISILSVTYPLSAQVVTAQKLLKSALFQETKLKQLYATNAPTAATERAIADLNKALEKQSALVFSALQKVDPKNKTAVRKGMQVIEQIQKIAERNMILRLKFIDRTAKIKGKRSRAK